MNQVSDQKTHTEHDMFWFRACSLTSAKLELTSHWGRRWAHPDRTDYSLRLHIHRPAGCIRAGTRPESWRKGPDHNFLAHGLEKSS